MHRLRTGQTGKIAGKLAEQRVCQPLHVGQPRLGLQARMPCLDALAHHHGGRACHDERQQQKGSGHQAIPLRKTVDAVEEPTFARLHGQPGKIVAQISGQGASVGIAVGGIRSQGAAENGVQISTQEPLRRARAERTGPWREFRQLRGQWFAG